MSKVKVKVKANGKETNIKVIITAIICITICELVAMALGFNGQILRWTLVAIAGLGGLMIPTPKISRGN